MSSPRREDEKAAIEAKHYLADYNLDLPFQSADSGQQRALTTAQDREYKTGSQCSVNRYSQNVSQVSHQTSIRDKVQDLKMKLQLPRPKRVSSRRSSRQVEPLSLNRSNSMRQITTERQQGKERHQRSQSTLASHCKERKDLIAKNRDLSHTIKSYISDRRQSKIKMEDLESQLRDMGDCLFQAQRRTSLDQMTNNRIIKDLMVNINQLKAEIADYKNNEKYLPEARKKKKSKRRKSNTWTLGPY